MEVWKRLNVFCVTMLGSEEGGLLFQIKSEYF